MSQQSPKTCSKTVVPTRRAKSSLQIQQCVQALPRTVGRDAGLLGAVVHNKRDVHIGVLKFCGNTALACNLLHMSCKTLLEVYEGLPPRFAELLGAS